MRDGVKLATDVYLPTRRAPSRDPDPDAVQHQRRHNVQDGCSSLSGLRGRMQDVRGRFDSEGEWTPFVHEAEDGYDAQEWCGTQPWSTGKVGTSGAPTSPDPVARGALPEPPSRRHGPRVGFSNSIRTGSTRAAPSSSASTSAGGPSRCTRGRTVSSTCGCRRSSNTPRSSGTSPSSPVTRAPARVWLLQGLDRHPDHGPTGSASVTSSGHTARSTSLRTGSAAGTTCSSRGPQQLRGRTGPRPSERGARGQKS